MPNQSGPVIVEPELVSFRSMTRIKDNIFAGVVEASLISSNLSFPGQEPVLISSLSMAGVETDRFVEILLLPSWIETHGGTRAEVSYFSTCYSLSGDEKFGIDVFDVPSKTMALETIPQGNTITHVTKVSLEIWKIVRKHGQLVSKMMRERVNMREGHQSIMLSTRDTGHVCLVLDATRGNDI